MKKRVFLSILLTSFATLFLTGSIMITVLYNDFSSEKKQELKTDAIYIYKAYPLTNLEYLKEIGKESKSRITLVSENGDVLYDNFAQSQTLENHKDRPEIAQALQNGTGEATRNSETLSEKTYYYAMKLDDGNILRIATTTKSFVGVLYKTAPIIIFIILISILGVVIVARLLTKAIVSPINKLNLDAPLSNNEYDELSPLLIRMDRQNKKIDDQLKKLTQKQKDFDFITDNMNEALVIFGGDGKVLSANKSAAVMFSLEDISNNSYLELCRDANYLDIINSAFKGTQKSTKFNKNGRIYVLSATPVKGSAAVLFGVDITEKEQAEKVRREFSANVSHELKTPLTSIMGCAEIMQNGLAKKEDFPHFSEQIYNESKRLLSLIEDIINLSRLDEGDFKNEFNQVRLKDVCEKAISALYKKAESKKVSLSFDGEDITINGFEPTLFEMVYNLCDNSITYNKEGGTVKINLYNDENNKIILSVADNGIGIEEKYKERVFERFFRVDKSHSKQTGGTGLGLSIVKHAALMHDAEIEIKSKVQEGTEIKIIFNKA
ncbi:MAG: ATP-binding protein [Oscillospiraceae bacterium]